MPNRRSFLQKAGLLGSLSLAAPGLLTASFTDRRQFSMQLDGNAIGVDVGQRELIELAHEYGFESVSADPAYLASLGEREMEALKTDMQNKMLVWGHAGLPVQFRKDATTFSDGMKRLPELAEGLQRAGVTRMTTWIMPNHSELNYLQNFRQHSVRLREVAAVLEGHNLLLGLEYVGPKTLQNANKYPFLSSMAETRELIAAIGKANVGYVLDSFHWYTAHEDVNDILTLDHRQIVACDLNDARSGLGPDEQIDGKRELPLATGIIDLKGFLEALMRVGYAGPVRAEPFNQALRDMPDKRAVDATSKAMKSAFALLS
jgi:sugar phosphate isomerase/epimerase